MTSPPSSPSSPAAGTSATPPSPQRLDTFREHWQDEGDAAFLYRVLADCEQNPQRRDVFRRLAEVEDRHVTVWEKLLQSHGAAP